MRVVLFYHSLISDWNHGNAHFLRGVVGDLIQRGVEADVYEPCDSWSARNLEAEHGEAALDGYKAAYPSLKSKRYDPVSLDLDAILKGTDLVLVHEWNDHDLVRRIGKHHASHAGEYVLLFHDTHHRAVSEPASMAAYDLEHYDGVLAFGKVIRDIYIERQWASRAWTWHEAADTQVFKPKPSAEKDGDLVWIGNWGDNERTAELHEFLLGPVKRLGLKAKVFGVRYPQHALDALADAGIEYGGWLPNYKAPELFGRYRMTVHVPRRPYVEALPGIPTIRVFEALACGIPLISAPWDDAEHLFTPGEDFLIAADGREMERAMAALLSDPGLSDRVASHGLQTIRARHTCSHRVDELLAIYEEVRGASALGVL